MFIKKGNRVYSDVYGMGTAITDESEIVGAIAKFDKENEHLFSVKDTYFMFTTIGLKLYDNLLKFDSLWAKKNYGVCHLKGNNPKQKFYSFENIEVKTVNQNKNNNKNIFKNSQFDESNDFVDKVIKDKKKTENMTIKDFAKEKENNMDNLYGYDATLKKDNKDKPCKNDSCACKNKDKDNKKETYIFVNKDNKELIYGNKEEVADFLWNIKDAEEVINETDDIEDFEVYKITGNVEKVPLKKTVKFSI